MSDASAERRKYFRIQDVLGIHYRPISQAQAEKHNFSVDQIAGLDSVVRLSQRAKLVLDKIRIRQPEVAELFEILNEKIDLVINSTPELREASTLEHQTKTVSLSACGIAFYVNENLAYHDYLLIDLQLEPSRVRIRALATVIDCQPVVEGHVLNTEFDWLPVEQTNQADESYPDLEAAKDSYLLRIEFKNLDESEEDLLVQHLFRKQSQMLKAKRLSQE